MKVQKQPLRGVIENRCSENMQQFTGEYPCLSAISIKLQRNFIEIALWHGCSPVNLLHIFRTPFPKNTPGWLFLKENMSFIINTVIVSKMLVPWWSWQVVLTLEIEFSIFKAKTIYQCYYCVFVNVNLHEKLCYFHWADGRKNNVHN